LPSERTQRLLDGGLVVVVGVQGRAQHDDPAAARDRPDDGVEGRVHLGEGLDVPYPGGVEDDGGRFVGGPGRQLRAGEDRFEIEVRLAGREVAQTAGQGGGRGGSAS
jgi:hypothetical protein